MNISYFSKYENLPHMHLRFFKLQSQVGQNSTTNTNRPRKYYDQWPTLSRTFLPQFPSQFAYRVVSSKHLQKSVDKSTTYKTDKARVIPFGSSLPQV
jgi:hypothetical protein